MMTYLHTLKQAFSDHDRPWVIAALRQDPVIWGYLISSESQTVWAAISEEHLPAQDWSPADLALKALGYPVPAQVLRSLPMQPIENTLRQRAARAFEAHTQDRPAVLDVPLTETGLAEAGLIALALRERRRMTGTWNGLAVELAVQPLRTWYTPLACLYALIPDPLALLEAVILPATHEAYALVLHMVLSQLLPPAEQLTLIRQLTAVADLFFLHALAGLRLTLAADLACQLEHEGQDIQHPPYTLISSLVTQLSSADLHQLSASPVDALADLSVAQKTAQCLQAEIAARAAVAEPLNAIPAWQQAVALAPENEGYRANLALTQLAAGETSAAAETLTPCSPDTTVNPGLLLALAQFAVATGDLIHARQIAFKTSEALQNTTFSSCGPEAISHIPPHLAELLLTLQLPADAARTVKLALVEQPSDSHLLSLLGQAQMMMGETGAATESYQLAAFLEPANSHLPRQLAIALENLPDWPAALEVRTAIASSTSLTSDFHALAACALRADQPQPAIQASLSALALDPEDGLAHAYLAEAFAAKNDTRAALTHFNQATLLAPHLPRPWLILARAHQQAGEPQKALEILRSAAQSATQSAEIQFTLGEAYLDANASTQALEAFQRAAHLDPNDPQIALRLGQAYHRLGHLEDARRVYETIWQPKDTPLPQIELAYSYAQTLLALGDLHAALPPLRAVVESKPAEASPYLDYACTLLTLQQNPEQAVDALRQALAIEAHLPVAHAFLAEALTACGDLPAAMDAYRAALETGLAQDILWHARLSLGLGKVALAMQQYDTAIAALHEAAQADPKSSAIHQLLAEAYLATGLQQNAMQAMQAVLQLADEDVDALIWYAEQTQQLASQKEQTSSGAAAAPQLYGDALKALSRAVEIAPFRADLWLRRAHAHLLAGDAMTAREDLRRLPSLGTASPLELRQAARWLLKPVEDPEGAVLCLQKAVDVLGNREGNPTHDQGDLNPLAFKVELLRELSHAYAAMCDPHTAIQTLDHAIELAAVEVTLAPEIPALQRAKADLLLEIGQSHNALACIEHALCDAPGDSELHSVAARILRSDGRLADALTHAHKAAKDHMVQSAAAEAVDLTRTLLQFEQARQLASLTCASRPSQPHPLISLLRAELALDAGEEIEAAQALSNALAVTMEDSPASALPDGPASALPSARILALQARLTARRGDYEAAVELFTDARSSISGSPENTGQSVDHLTLQALAATASELGLWDDALRLSRQGVEQSPKEPYAHWLLARALLRRAEYQRLCVQSDVLTHAPGPEVLAESASVEFDMALQSARLIIENQPLDHCASDESDGISPLSSLQAHGQSIFRPEVILPGVNAEDVSWIDDGALDADDVKPLPAIQNSQFTIPQYRRAQTALREKDLETARRSIEMAVGLWPDEPRWQSLAAQIEMVGGNPQAAIPHIEQAIKVEPRHPNHHLLLGHALLSLAAHDPAQRKPAMRAYERACRLSPDELEPWLALAQAQLLTNDLDQAAVSAERAVNLAPEMIEPLLLRARIALQSSDYPTVLNYAQSALNIQPGESDALLLFTRALQALDRPSEALTALEKSLPLTGASVETPLPLKIQRIELLRQSQGAQAALGPAVELARALPNEPVVLATLAHTQAETGEHAAAIRTAQLALQLGGGQGTTLDITAQAKLHHLLGSLLRRAGQLDQAVQQLHQAVELSPDWLDPYLDLGQAQQERRQYRQALQTYKQAIAIAPYDPRPYFQAGLALKDGKSYVEAESMLRRAASLAPKDVTIRRQLAAVVALNLIHSAQRQPAPARASYAESKEQGSSDTESRSS